MKNQHEVTYYYGNLPDGKYEINIVSGDGTKHNEPFEIKSDKPIWMFVTYWNSNKKANIDVFKQNEPIKIR